MCLNKALNIKDISRENYKLKKQKETKEKIKKQK